MQIKEDGDSQLVESLLSTMHKSGADFTNTFRAIGEAEFNFGPDLLDHILTQCASADEIRAGLKPTMADRDLYMLAMMAETNPGILQAMGRAGLRLKREIELREKLNEIKDLTDTTKRDQDSQLWSTWLDFYRARLQRDLAAAGSPDAALAARRRATSGANPRLVLRNHLAELAIREAEKGNFGPTSELLRGLQDTYGSDEARAPCSFSAQGISFEDRPPSWAADLRVS